MIETLRCYQLSFFWPESNHGSERIFPRTRVLSYFCSHLSYFHLRYAPDFTIWKMLSLQIVRHWRKGRLWKAGVCGSSILSNFLCSNWQGTQGSQAAPEDSELSRFVCGDEAISWQDCQRPILRTWTGCILGRLPLRSGLQADHHRRFRLTYLPLRFHHADCLPRHSVTFFVLRWLASLPSSCVA